MEKKNFFRTIEQQNNLKISPNLYERWPTNE